MSSPRAAVSFNDWRHLRFVSLWRLNLVSDRKAETELYQTFLLILPIEFSCLDETESIRFAGGQNHQVGLFHD